MECVRSRRLLVPGTLLTVALATLLVHEVPLLGSGTTPKWYQFSNQASFDISRSSTIVTLRAIELYGTQKSAPATFGP